MPEHALRPVTGIKTSILVRQKKSDAMPEPTHLFVGSVRSLAEHEMNDVIEAFRDWYKEGTWHG